MIELPTGPFNVILSDPPWQYNDRGIRGGTKKHYRTMSKTELKRMPVWDITAQDAALFMWGTYPLLMDMMEVGNAWGFTYKTIAFQWVKRYKNGKPFIGGGHWTRSNSEGCFLFIKGKTKYLPRARRDISQIVETVPTRHSAKPPIVRENIVKLLGNLPRVELFARDRAEGWEAWGDELEQN